MQTSIAFFTLLLVTPLVIANQNDNNSTANHLKFDQLNKPFINTQAVTKACLQCHTEASKQLHQTTHWKLEYIHPDTGQKLGKRNILNNYCGSIISNYPRCTSCHIGYDWKDTSFDFTNEYNVDCLICHDTTGTYAKFPTDAGQPAYIDKVFPKGSENTWYAPDLKKVARNVGKSRRHNCGRCHFFGGGGDGAKHGDLDSSLTDPDWTLDVHMDVDGPNFSCAECHASSKHQIQGSRYSGTAKDTHGIDIPGNNDGSRASCESCHGLVPHKKTLTDKLNDHVDKIACQTCHIPSFARGSRPTKVWWDWSTAGKLTSNGKPITRQDTDGNVIYSSKKGDMTWLNDVQPEYNWFNGTITYTLLGETIDPSNVVSLNKISGDYLDTKARIWPFKIMRGKQPYDTGNNTLIVTHIYGKDDSAFWTNYNWDKAIKTGMRAAKLPYSGSYDFIETKMYWPITHMVAPADDALTCEACHSKNGRLDKLKGFYLPGRDVYFGLDRFGWGLVSLTLLVCLVHLAVRIISHNKRMRQ